MAVQPKPINQTSHVNIDTIEFTSRDVEGGFSLKLKGFLKPSSTTIKTLGFIAYILFLAWQVIGLVLYSIRAFETSLSAKHTSFQSTDIETFRHSEQLELVWIISQIFNTGLVILALPKVPSFLGYHTILRLLVRLPNYWSLVSLYGMCIIGYFVIIGLKNDSAIEITLIVAFMIAEGAQIILIGFLSFTQVNHSRKKYPFKIFGFLKLNIFLLFLTYFVEFVIGSFQFALHIYGIDDDDLGISSDFLTLIGTIRRFTAVVFCYRIYNFYWQKLFVDNRNILCHYDYLDQFNENSPQDSKPSTPANPA